MSPINNTDTIFYWITGNALILLRDDYQGKYTITYQMNNHGMISLQLNECHSTSNSNDSCHILL